MKSVKEVQKSKCGNIEDLGLFGVKGVKSLSIIKQKVK